MRQSGYYWVKYSFKWEVAEFASFHTPEFGGPYGWFRHNNCELFKDEDFKEIDENRIERRERPQSVVIPDPLPTIQIRHGKKNPE